MTQQRVMGVSYTIDVSEPFTIACPMCYGSGWRLASKAQPAYPEGAKFTVREWLLNGQPVEPEGFPVVEKCSFCKGTKTMVVVEQLSEHKHSLLLLEGPNVDNNWQGVFRCDECHTIVLGSF